MKKNLFFFLSLFMLSVYQVAYGQQRMVSGTVYDSSNESLPGVTVVVKGTMTGTVTDLDGNFQLNVPTEATTLLFSFVGYTTQEVSIVGKDKVEVTMQTSTQDIDEVVVVGYGTMRKSDLTGSVARVSGDDLQKVASPDAIQALQGKVSGVDISANSGEPGSGVRIRVRGVGSWSNSDPIYIIDGMAVGDASSVDPSNIESIEILKDASATAIYGSRGANGVVLITTKSGAKGKAIVEASAYAGVQYTNSYVDMVNATDFAKLRIEAYKNDGKENLIPADERAILDYVIANNYKGTDWQDELINPAPIQNYNVSIRGGNDNSSYNIGATYFNQEGLVKNSGMDKIFTWANNSYKLTDKIKLDLNVSYTYFKKNNHNNDAYSGALPVALRMDPITPAWDDYTNNYGARFMGGVVTVAPSLAVDEAKYDISDGNKLLSNVKLKIDDLFSKGLSLNAMYGADLNFNNSSRVLPEYWLAPDQKRDQSSIYNYRFHSYNWQVNGYLNYNNQFGDHSINAMLGAEAQQFKGDEMSATGYDVPYVEALMYLNNARNKETMAIGGTAYKSTLASFFSRLNYNYKNRYMITATMRADGSSKFLGSNKWGYFPSVSGAWNLKEESFMQDNILFNLLKIRAGWGQVGNSASVGNYAYATTMTTGYTYVFGVNETIVDGAKAAVLSNEEIKWETSEQMNFGVDAAFLKQRMNVTIDYFDKKTKDLQLSKPIPDYAGMGRPTVNAGTMRNYGLELALGWSDKKGDFRYSVGLTGTILKNKVTDMGGGDPIYGGSVFKQGNTTRTVQGMEFAHFYGLKTDGIFNDQAELDAYTWTNKETNQTNLIQPKAQPGDVKFVDLNNDGKIDGNDRTYLGSAFPDFSGSLNLNLSYKNFDFQAFVFATFGNEIANAMSYNIQTSSILSNYHKDRLGRWTQDNTSSNVPRMTSNDANGNQQFSDLDIEDGSYIRLRNVQLGYTFPKTLTSKIGVSKLRVYVSGDNLITLTDYSGWNPEIAGGGLNGGVDYATYPVPSIVSGGLNITF